jgi:hypothetical protein
MKTTLNIDDTVFQRLKLEAGRQGKTMSELVETGLRLLFRSPRASGGVRALPTFKSGGHRVDVSNREALHEAMDRG